jgi:hypothetical protein
MSQRITDASAKVARSFYLLPRMTDNVLFGLSRTMTGLSGEVVQHLNVLKSFSSYSGRQHAEQPLAAVHEQVMARMRHSKIADGRPLSVEERSCSGHHRHDRVGPKADVQSDWR